VPSAALASPSTLDFGAGNSRSFSRPAAIMHPITILRDRLRRSIVNQEIASAGILIGIASSDNAALFFLRDAHQAYSCMITDGHIRRFHRVGKRNAHDVLVVRTMVRCDVVAKLNGS
jgi:hypothetical protein